MKPRAAHTVALALAFAVALSASACSPACERLAEKICACDGINPDYCTWANETAKLAEEDDSGFKARNCRDEIGRFCCAPYRYTSEDEAAAASSAAVANGAALSASSVGDDCPN